VRHKWPEAAAREGRRKQAKSGKRLSGTSAIRKTKSRLTASTPS